MRQLPVGTDIVVDRATKEWRLRCLWCGQDIAGTNTKHSLFERVVAKAVERHREWCRSKPHGYRLVGDS